MTLDGGRGGADPKDMAAVAIVEALLIELDTRPRYAVSEALGLKPSQATRILDGTRPLLPYEIATIEQAWGLQLGTILRRAGLVIDNSTVRSAIAGDPALTPRQREVILLAYDSLAQLPPTKSRTTRRTSRN